MQRVATYITFSRGFPNSGAGENPLRDRTYEVTNPPMSDHRAKTAGALGSWLVTWAEFNLYARESALCSSTRKNPAFKGDLSINPQSQRPLGVAVAVCKNPVETSARDAGDAIAY